MDKLKQYRSILEDVFQAQADLMNSQPVPGEQVDCVFDEQRNHYLLLKYGWPRGRLAHYTKLHARLQAGKIWIEADLTEEGLGNQLVEAGIPREDIVLAFNSPKGTSLSEFASA